MEVCQICDAKTSNCATACCAKILCRVCKYMCNCDGNATMNWNKLYPEKVKRAQIYYAAHIDRDQRAIITTAPPASGVVPGINYLGEMLPAEVTEIRRLD